MLASKRALLLLLTLVLALQGAIPAAGAPAAPPPASPTAADPADGLPPGFTLDAGAPAALPPGFTKAPVVSGLTLPTAFAFTPDNRIIFTQKQGVLRLWKQGQLLSTPFLTLNVTSNSERGALGIAVDPNFASNQFVYVYYTTASANPKNRVSRFTAVGDVADPASEVVLVDGIASDAGNHNAGCLRFGLEGKLYISTGDGGANAQNSQDLGNLNGKILRINSNGSIPADNPFVGVPGARGEIWAYGLRNPFRFGVQPSTGLLFAGDPGSSGPNATEEINVIEKGGNYGWPIVEGPSGDPEFIDPLYWYSTFPSAAIIGGVFYEGTRFPPLYRRGYYFGDEVRNWIRVLLVDENNNLLGVRDFDTAADTPVDFASRFGRLFFLSYLGGTLYAIAYTG